MAGHGYGSDDKDPIRIYTPSMDSEEDMPRMSNLSLSERDYRQFTFRKEGRSWANQVSTETTSSESDIMKKAKRNKTPTQSIAQQLEKMSVPRRNAVEDLLRDVEQDDPNRERWEIVAIDNDRPDVTKRMGEVITFSVILARVNRTRQRTGSASRERKRPPFQSSSQEYVVPERSVSKSYHRDNRNARQNQNMRNSQPIVEDDPFNSTNLFSSDGKPMNLQNSTAHINNVGLPSYIPQDQPIGAKADRGEKGSKTKNKKFKGGRGFNDNEHIIAVDDDYLGPVMDDGRDAVDFDYNDPVQIIHEDNGGPRGRMQNDMDFVDSSSGPSRSKSKPHRPSVRIPNKDQYRPSRVTADSRRPREYHGSPRSATGFSNYSDQSPLEAEYEDYSSSGSNAGGDPGWQGQYVPSNGRYTRATRDHRRGPPSPQQARYDMSDNFSRRPRHERYASDGAIQPYSFGQPSLGRSPVINQRYVPRAGYPLTSSYTYDTGMMPYPSDLATASRRNESAQAFEAERHIRRDRELELLQRERDVAEREAQQLRNAHMAQQGIPTMGSMRSSSKRYTHEPRLSRRYTTNMGYHG